MLHSLGSNGSGQLGIGNEEDVSSPEQCVLDMKVDEKSLTPSKIAAGGNHTLILSSSGILYACGEKSDGRCGQIKLQGQAQEGLSKSSKFLQTGCKNGGAQDDTFSFCAATWEASILISADRKHVFTCGSGSKGELGQGAGVLASPHPCCILDLEGSAATIVDVSASMSHAVVVLSDGSVCGWGVGRKGQLGMPTENSWVPRVIDCIPFKAARAVCGREFTYVVSDSNEGRHIILGSDKWNVRSNAPESVKGWKDIGASWGSVYVLFETGRLCGWGRNDHGQLPPPDCPLLYSFAAGSEHVIARTKMGEVIAWGWGEHGNCGRPSASNGDVVGRWNVLPRNGNISFVAAGCATSWLWSDDLNANAT